MFTEQENSSNKKLHLTIQSGTYFAKIAKTRHFESPVN